MTATATRRLGASALALLVVVARRRGRRVTGPRGGLPLLDLLAGAGRRDRWAFATDGPASSVPADGSVEGWRFAVTTRPARPDDAPARLRTSTRSAAARRPQPDRKRVGARRRPGPGRVSLRRASAPRDDRHVRRRRPEDATGYEVLRSVTEVRTEDGLVCGVAGYPTGECAPVLDEAEAAALVARAEAAPAAVPVASSPTVSGMDDAGRAAGDAGGSPLPTVLAIAVLAGIAVVLALRYRRTR